ncbi:MAG: ABC transporter ATP-binding protein [Actinomycetota bacterium]|jgi:NitT/TauT family transport system ATP-binding protein|nr:ABC transporter ATP-binding protein [Actinomycetota bacterium]
MAVLSLRDVTLCYGDSGPGGRPAVLDRIDVEVAEQEFVTILGPSGCGKTSLLRLVAGFERANGGSIVFDGKEVTGPSSERVVVFQQPWLYPWLNLRENVAFGLKLQKRKVDWQRVDEMIATVGLSGYEKHAPYHLSGGMQQRAALARALVMEPKLLLMDEPFGALDAQTRQRLQEFLLDLWTRVDVTVVFITHDVEEAILLGDRMLIMSTSPGRIALEQKIDIPRPRDESTTLSAPFQQIRKQALATLGRVSIAAAGITGTGDRSAGTDEGGSGGDAESGGERSGAPSGSDDVQVAPGVTMDEDLAVRGW